jgi:hypothetical protein
MKVAVWDTYVKRTDGRTMHFDILVPDTLKNADTIYQYGHQYLKNKPVLASTLTTSECKFCHIEQATPEVEASVNKNGYHIIELKHCQ